MALTTIVTGAVACSEEVESQHRLHSGALLGQPAASEPALGFMDGDQETILARLSHEAAKRALKDDALALLVNEPNPGHHESEEACDSHYGAP
ncbi:hypothetical protein NDU88_005964 [Pleurodeles waltl]|uniref:Uncharacterized protein n=1 Tax=Pleurodeles waltl TaxID=8319 RepID=A0AAV7WYL4_PLEWA|nr:hypothetical protein NDU88_005964 [Pleurodeles waltl]